MNRKPPALAALLLAALLFAASLALAGCSMVSYSDRCIKFSAESYFTVTSFDRVYLKEKPTTVPGECTAYFDATGAESDQVKAVRAAVEAAVSAAAKSVVP